MKKFYICWNEARSEGFITDSYNDAMECVGGDYVNFYSTAGEAFYQCYEDDERFIEEVELPDEKGE